MNDWSPDHVQWMYLRNSKWHFFTSIDTARIEASWKGGQHNDRINVEQGRFEVHLSQMQMFSMYWTETPFRVLRSTWTYQVGDLFYPFELDEAEKLDHMWRLFLQYHHANDRTVDEQGRVKTPSARYVIRDHISSIETKRVKISPDFKDNQNIIHTTLVSNQTASSSVTAIHRGRHHHHAGGDNINAMLMTTVPQNMNPVSDLIFVVHGIGEYFIKNNQSYEVPSIIDSVNGIRNMSNRMISGDRPSSIEYIPIEWADVVRKGDDLLSEISLDSVMGRSLTNELLSDILFYLVRKDEIQSHVIQEINTVYSLFLQRNPSFDGKVSVMGHSLGSVIAFDILRDQNEDQPPHGRFNFEFQNFFAFGSPIGLFEAVKGKRLGENLSFQKCPKVFNIFTPSDPVAYRLEPLICREFQSVPPVRVETFSGGDHIPTKMRDFGEKVAGAMGFAASLVGTIMATAPALATTSDAPSTTPGRCGKLNQGGRLDYQLQNTTYQEINKISTTLSSHSSYWTSQDFLLFVVKKLAPPPPRASVVDLSVE